jgi:hypothetical protein
MMSSEDQFASKGIIGAALRADLATSECLNDRSPETKKAEFRALQNSALANLAISP